MYAMSPYLDVIETLSVIMAAGVAIWNLNTWRREIIGQKRAELVESTLTLFYEARDIIRAVRSPTGFAEERKTRPRTEDDATDERRYLDSVYVPINRLNRENSFFAQIKFF
jgi:hypothetical protein